MAKHKVGLECLSVNWRNGHKREPARDEAVLAELRHEAALSESFLVSTLDHVRRPRATKDHDFNAKLPGVS
jgi:hypothetical protein